MDYELLVRVGITKAVLLCYYSVSRLCSLPFQGRLIRQENGGVRFEARNASGLSAVTSMDAINIKERDMFQKGEVSGSWGDKRDVVSGVGVTLAGQGER